MNTLSSEFIKAYLHEIGIYTPLLPLAKSAEEPPQGVLSVAPKVVETIAPKAPPPLAKNIQNPMVNQGITLHELETQVTACTACALSKQRKHTVFGRGNKQAELVFIGDAPDADDDREGTPFAGKSGVLLERMIAAMGMQREQVYTMHTMKCRPPWNRDPSSEEIAACRVYFDAQLQALRPKVMCLLGRVTAQQVLGNQEGLTALREGVHDYQGIPVHVTYHPAYLLRNPARKQQTWLDLQKLM